MGICVGVGVGVVGRVSLPNVGVRWRASICGGVVGGAVLRARMLGDKCIYLAA